MSHDQTCSGTIICADSDVSRLDYYAQLLAEKGYSVRTCTNGLDIIAELESSTIDLIAIGTGIAKSSSVSICKMISQRTNNSIPLILIADPEDQDLIMTSMKEGAHDFVVTPVKTIELLTKVAVTIDKLQSQVTMTVQSQSGADSNCQNEIESNTATEPDFFAGHYEILTLLGEGSYSEVFHAIDRSKPEPFNVALKVFDMDSYQHIESSFQSFLLREAYEMSKLEHPNIVKMIDFGKYESSYYMVLEFVSGESLRDVVKSTGPFDEGTLVYVGYQASQVLQYLESQKLIHRDIKPENILINGDGDIKFTDFGLARHKSDNALTLKNAQFMGTPEFVAPELIVPDKTQGQEIDIRCDVYSLGVTLYYCATGSVPFTGKNVVEILFDNLNNPAPQLCQVSSEISQSFSKIVEKMMEKKKEDRPSPTELQHQLRGMIGK